MNVGKRVSELRWSDAEATIPPGHRINEPKPLFRKITSEEVEEQVQKLLNRLKK
jgi:methionyl-tRNA synthetase